MLPLRLVPSLPCLPYVAMWQQSPPETVPLLMCGSASDDNDPHLPIRPQDPMCCCYKRGKPQSGGRVDRCRFTIYQAHTSLAVCRLWSLTHTASNKMRTSPSSTRREEEEGGRKKKVLATQSLHVFARRKQSSCTTMYARRRNCFKPGQ